MKKICFILFFFPIIGFGQAPQLNWSSFTTISSNSDGYGRPRIVLTANNYPLIIWRKDNAPKVLRASKWNGNSFSAPYDILQLGIAPSSWDGPEVAAYGDTVYVVFTSLATTQSSIMLIQSFDGGITFSDTIRVSENNPAYKYRMANISVKDDGNPVVSYMEYMLNWMDPKQMVNTSSTFGNSFNGAVNGSFLSPGEPCDCCKSSLVCSGNDVFLLYRNNDNNIRNSYISKSIDGGLSFISTTDLDTYDWMLNSCPATTPRGLIIGDSITIVKRSGATGNNEVVCSNINSTDLNYTYNRNIDFISNNTIQDYPELAANGDTVVVVWQDNRTGMQDCYMSLSVEGVSKLHGAISFTDTSLIGQRLDPDVAYYNGQIHLVYLDHSHYKIVYVKAAIDGVNTIDYQFDSGDSKIIRVIDILGRESSHRKTKPLFYIYDNGTVEKKIIID